MRVSSDGELTKLFTEQVNVPNTSDGGNKIVRVLSYFAVKLSVRYWVVMKVSFIVRVSPSLTQVTFVGGDPIEEQFRVKAAAEISSNDNTLIGANKRKVMVATFCQ